MKKIICPECGSENVKEVYQSNQWTLGKDKRPKNPTSFEHNFECLDCFHYFTIQSNTGSLTGKKKKISFPLDLNEWCIKVIKSGFKNKTYWALFYVESIDGTSEKYFGSAFGQIVKLLKDEEYAEDSILVEITHNKDSNGKWKPTLSVNDDFNL